MRAQWLVAAAGIAAAAAVAWALLRGPDGDPRPDEGDGLAGRGDRAPEEAAMAGLAAPSAAKDRPKPVRGGRCEVVGTVRRDGKPAAARVEVRRTQAYPPEREPEQAPFALARSVVPVAARATAGDDGRFSLGGLTTGSYEVVAIAADGAAGSASAWLAADGVRVEANPDLVARRESLLGRVVHADGRPWKGTVVVAGEGGDLVSAWTGASSLLATDEQGRFEAHGLAAGKVTILAAEEGVFQVSSGALLLPHAGEYVLRIEADLVEVTGRVLDAVEGAPLAAAQVVGFVRPASGGFSQFRAVADGGGRFRVLVSGENGSVTASAPGFADESVEVADVKAPLEIRLSKAARIRGRVTSAEDGHPVGGVRIFASRVDDFYGSGPDGDGNATTDADGRYEVRDLRAGSWAVSARGAGWISAGFSRPPGTANPFAVALPAGAETVVDLSVARGARVTGVVLDSLRSPVSGAFVRAEGAGGTIHYSWRRRPGFSPADYAHGGDHAASGADGAFAIDSLVPGVDYSFEATAAGSASGRAGPVTASLESEVRVEIRLPAPRWAEIVVVAAATGAPISGVSVEVSPRQPEEESEPSYHGMSFRRSASPGTGTTDSLGHAHLGPLPEGPLEVTASAKGYVSPRDAVALEGSESPSAALAATVRLESGFTLAGRVVLPDGSPAAGAEVTATPRGESVETDAAGAFRFEDLPGGRYTLHATLSRDTDELLGAAEGVAGESEVTISLAKGHGERRVVVKVLDATGKPVPAAEAELQFGHSTSSTSVQNGRVTFDMDDFEAPDDEEGTVEIWQARAADGTPLPYGRTRLEGVRPGQEYEIRLAPELRIEGRVLGPDGKGVAGAVVLAIPSSGGPEEDVSEPSPWTVRGGDGGVTTDASGAFAVGGLAAGDHVVTVRPPPEYSRPAPVKAKAGATGVEVRLRAGVSATITVLDWQGKPVSGAHAVASARSGRQGWRHAYSIEYADRLGLDGEGTGGDGRVVLGSLDPAVEYTLKVRGPLRRTDLVAFESAPWAPADTRVQLERGYAVQGVVQDAAGRPVPSARVECSRTGDEAVRRATTGKDGAFRFTGLRAGPVDLVAQLSEMYSDESSSALKALKTVAAPSEGVVLVLDTGVTLVVRVEDWADRTKTSWVEAELSEEGQEGPSASARVDSAGVARFRGLRADKSYALWIEPDSTGRIVYATGLKAGGPEVRVKTSAGKPITGRLRLPPGATEADVSINQRGVSSWVSARRDGQFVIRAVPEGTWTLEASAEVGGKSLSGSATAPAGGSVDIEMKPEK